MQNQLIKKFSCYIPSIASGILVVLSFPFFDLYFLSWAAFVPLILSLWKTNSRQAFISGFTFGIIYFFGTQYWIYHSINHYGGISFITSIAIVLLLCCYLSLYPAIFSVLFSSMINKTKLPALLIAPVSWVVLEFIRSYAFSGFPWSSIGYSQYKFLYIIQLADITGIYGISFLVLAVNGAVSDIFLLKKRITNMPLFPVLYTIIGFFVLSILVVFSISYSIWRLNQNRTGNFINVSIIQGNIEQDKKWEPLFQKEVMDIYTSLTSKAAESSPDLIVWPETSVPFLFERDTRNTEKLIAFQKTLNTHLLFGSVLVQKNSSETINLANSAVLLDKEGKKTFEYDKIHLVPFGEYVPLRSILFFIDKLVTGIGDYIPGKHYIKAETSFGNFAAVICYEIIFPGLIRKFFTNDGVFIVNITNDAWFGKTAGPYQHFSMAVFRALENKKPVIRAANTGISGFISSNGEILASSSLFQRQILSSKLKTDTTLTFYTKYGDLFSYFCMVIFVILLINLYTWRS